MTSAISGRPSIGLSASDRLASCLESRLRLKTASLGSTLYSLIWRQRVTPRLRSICALRASARRIYASGLSLRPSGWGTPTATDAVRGVEDPRPQDSGAPLTQQAALAGWATPSSRDGKGGYLGGRIRNGKLSTDTLDVTAQLACPVRLLACGQLLTGSAAAMKSPGQLNPAHSRWLMGLPAVWDACAPMVTRSSRK